METADHMIFTNQGDVRPAGAAALADEITARAETTALGRRDQAWDIAGNSLNAMFAAGQAVQKLLRVRMRGKIEKAVIWGRFHLLSGVHDRDPVADLISGPQVMGGEQHGDASIELLDSPQETKGSPGRWRGCSQASADGGAADALVASSSAVRVAT